MLEKHSDVKKYTGTVNTLRTIASEEGALALYKGVEPRVMWITIGGFIFFGAYEQAPGDVRGSEAGGVENMHKSTPAWTQRRPQLDPHLWDTGEARRRCPTSFVAGLEGRPLTGRCGAAGPLASH